MLMSEFGNLQEQYWLQKGPAIFFYRRATEYGNCTAKKHEEIRNFITSTVRKKSPIYLSKIPITEIIQKLKTIKWSKWVSKLEKYEQYSAILVEDVFNEHLRTEIQNDVSWPLFWSIQKIVSTG